jgi:hypothetical protein
VARKIFLSVFLLAALGALSASSASAMDLERLIAPTDVCAEQTDPEAPISAQEGAMRCMIDFAREQMGVARVDDAVDLDRSAREKSDDILRCDSFSHNACGHEFTYWMQRVGYIPARCWRVGENIAWGVHEYGSARSIFRAWIYSPEHRENILGPFTQIGVGLAVARLNGRSDAHVWTQHFGSHCDQPDRASPTPPLTGLTEARAVG